MKWITTSPALTAVLGYYHAWTAKDMDSAMIYVADDIVCEARRRAGSRVPSGTGRSWHRSRTC
jgi:hypothetical protein